MTELAGLATVVIVSSRQRLSIGMVRNQSERHLRLGGKKADSSVFSLPLVHRALYIPVLKVIVDYDAGELFFRKGLEYRNEQFAFKPEHK